MENNFKELLKKIIFAACTSGNFQYAAQMNVSMDVATNPRELITAIENGNIEKITLVIRIRRDIYLNFIDPVVENCKDEDPREMILQGILYILKGVDPGQVDSDPSYIVKIEIKRGMELLDVVLPF